MKRPTTGQIREELVPIAGEIAATLLPSEPLDYAPESVRTVEKVLALVHEEYVASGSDDGLEGIALEFAAYLVEVIDRNYGPVEWQRDDPGLGRDSFPLVWRGSTLFPLAWCQKRIFEGPGDDVWTKFVTLVRNKAEV